MEGWTNGQFVGLIGRRTNGQFPVFGLCEEAGGTQNPQRQKETLKKKGPQSLGIALATILSWGDSANHHTTYLTLTRPSCQFFLREVKSPCGTRSLR